MKNLKTIVIVILVILGLFYIANVLGVVNAQPAPSKAAFDHSNCQYPDRWSNPADGCDNSDPAVPECIKGFSTEQGEKDCIAQFTSAQKTPATEALDPNRDYFDECGNRYSYDGKLESRVADCTPFTEIQGK